jgi:predicted double-glycine peptidase
MANMIVQEDDMGCGAACVAFVARKEYEEVARWLGCTKAAKLAFY